MFITIRSLLNEQELELIHRELESAEFDSGKVTAGAAAKAVKENLQVDSADPCAEAAGRIVVGALQKNEPFLISARPKHILAPMFSRYRSAMSYGRHLDNPIMGRSMSVRTDVSVTVFLNSASAYEGGELIIESDYGPAKFKGDAGDAVVYPSTMLHSVSQVTSGERLVAVTWAQSMIRNPEQRKLLFDLAILERRLKELGLNEGELAEKCHFNLFRMWADV